MPSTKIINPIINPKNNRESNRENSHETLAGKIAERISDLPAPLALVGFGVEGRDTLRFLLAHGATELQVFDRALDGPAIAAAGVEYPGVKFFWEGGWEKSLPECGTIFRSPGVRPDHPALEAAQRAGAEITSATRLFLELNPGCSVGVTGTVGKGTTVSLIGEALGAIGIPFRLGGNIGVNPLSFLAAFTPAHVAVLELSSFQLMDLNENHPQLALVLRTSSEHLDWHSDIEEYTQAKRCLLAPPERSQRIIYCADSQGSRDILGERIKTAWGVSLTDPVASGIGMSEGGLHRFREGRGEPLPGLESLAMQGRFNLENAAAALLAVEWVAAEWVALEWLEKEGMKTDRPTEKGPDMAPALKAITAFPGLPHRLERVGEKDGLSCINDSYATRPEATLGALSAFTEPLAVILGGSEKFADFTELSQALCNHESLKLVTLMGSTAERLEKEIRQAAQELECPPPTIQRAGDLAEAFQAARAALPDGGVLLFSPACASFDMFPNYKIRGERFKALVEKAGLRG